MGKVAKIIYLFFQNRYSKNTEQRIMNWLAEDERNEEKNEALKACWDKIPADTHVNVRRSFQVVREKSGIKKKNIIFQPYFRVAAVLLPLLVVFTSFYFFSGQSERVTNDKIILSEVSVPFGEQEMVDMSDGSTIWLNAGSHMVKKDERQVQLEGEAFFKVAKNEAHPFIVKTGSLQIDVLGTEFNVKDYPDEERAIVSLRSGKVRLKTSNGEEITLLPGQQCVYNTKTGEAIVMPVTKGHVPCAWRKGQLIFDKTPAVEIVKALERCLDISVEIRGEFMPEDLYSVKFDREEDLREIGQVLADIIGNCKCEVENKTIVLVKE